MCEYQNREVITMTPIEKLREMAESSSNGIITSKQVREAEIHPHYLQQLVKNGELVQVSRGIYQRCDSWDDELYNYQLRYKRGVFSHDTALYLHGYSDRTPEVYTMTFPSNYHAKSIEEELLRFHRTIQKNYEIGLTLIDSPSGNKIFVYDIERTLCDIVRGEGCDIQIVVSAMKQYASSNQKDIHKLMKYAEQLRVKPKIMRYMEVLM